MPAVVRRLFLYWLPRFLLIRRPMYHLRAGRKLYNRPRPLQETRYPVSRHEMTSNIGRRVETTAALTGTSEVRRRRLPDDSENNPSSFLDDVEVRRALEAVKVHHNALEVVRQLHYNMEVVKQEFHRAVEVVNEELRHALEVAKVLHNALEVVRENFVVLRKRSRYFLVP